MRKCLIRSEQSKCRRLDILRPALFELLEEFQGITLLVLELQQDREGGGAIAGSKLVRHAPVFRHAGERELDALLRGIGIACVHDENAIGFHVVCFG